MDAIIKEIKLIQAELIVCKDELRIEVLGKRLDIIEKRLEEMKGKGEVKWC